MDRKELKNILEQMLWQIGLVWRYVPVRDEHILAGRFLAIFGDMINKRFAVKVEFSEEDRTTLGEVLDILQKKLAG